MPLRAKEASQSNPVSFTALFWDVTQLFPQRKENPQITMGRTSFSELARMSTCIKPLFWRKTLVSNLVQVIVI